MCRGAQIQPTAPVFCQFLKPTNSFWCQSFCIYHSWLPILQVPDTMSPSQRGISWPCNLLRPYLSPTLLCEANQKISKPLSSIQLQFLLCTLMFYLRFHQEKNQKFLWLGGGGDGKHRLRSMILGLSPESPREPFKNTDTQDAP